MIKYLLMAACLTFSVSRPAMADRCFMSYVRISSGGAVILGTGIRYIPYPGRDRVAANLWLPRDKVEVCHLSGGIDQITNLSRSDYQTIKALKNMQ